MTSKKPLRIYISGKISGIEEEAFANFERAEKHLLELGYVPVNPMKLTHNHDKSWNSFMREDISAMMTCDGIYLLNNFKHSRGAILEHLNAVYLDFIILHEDDRETNN